MRNSEWSKLLSVAGRILLAFLFVFSQSARAGQDPKARDNLKLAQQTAVQQTAEKPSYAAMTTRTEAEEEQAETAAKLPREENFSGGRKHEGIKIHGHWTIEVHNPDGTLATRRVFENAYQPNIFLAGILARQASVGFWSVVLASSNGATSPCLSGGSPVACQIFEAGAFAAGLAPSSGFFNTLTVNTNANVAANSFTLVFAGTATVGQTGVIDTVITDATTCVNSTPPSTPCFGPSIQFTAASLAAGSSNPPINVSLGQLVSVTVVISFS